LEMLSSSLTTNW